MKKDGFSLPTPILCWKSYISKNHSKWKKKSTACFYSRVEIVEKKTFSNVCFPYASIKTDRSIRKQFSSFHDLKFIKYDNLIFFLFWFLQKVQNSMFFDIFWNFGILRYMLVTYVSTSYFSKTWCTYNLVFWRTWVWKKIFLAEIDHKMFLKIPMPLLH